MAVDPQALLLSRAIALQETGGDINPNKLGDNGTAAGIGQWSNQIGGKAQPLAPGQIPANFKSYAQKYGTDPNDFSQENQERTLYNEVEYKKNTLGWTPAQIAASHNAGDKAAADGSWQHNVGSTTLNGKAIDYNTPQYVQNVKNYYDKLSGESGASPLPGGANTAYAAETGGVPQAPQPSSPILSAQDDLGAASPSPADSSLGTELKGRLSQASGALGDAASGKINPISGLLQAFGAGAGAVGDVTGKALDLIPGVKGVENLIGQGVGSLAKTQAGQAVTNEIQSFAQAHPELAKDIGAGFNLATAIPIFKGLGVLKDAAGDAASQGLKNVAEKSFIKGAPDLFTTSKAKQFVADNPNVFKDMVDNRMVGDIKDGQYVTGEAAQQSQNVVQDLNKQVDAALSAPAYQTPVDGESIAQKALDGFTDRNGKNIPGIPRSGLSPEQLIANAKKLDSDNALLWDKFANGEATLKEVNQLRQSLDSKVKKAYIGNVSFDAPEISTSKGRGALLAGAMRDYVQSTAKETQPLFQEMSKHFKIQQALKYMNGKEVKPGAIASLAGHAVGMGTGGTIGTMIGGTPGAILGGMVGDRAAGSVASKLAGRKIVQGVLKRTGTGAVTTPKKKIGKGVAGLVAGTEAQKASD